MTARRNSHRAAAIVAIFLGAADVEVRAAQVPTFHRDVEPIVLEHCAVCHHPGGDGPFSLIEYRDVKKRARLVAHVTGKRYMPPWPPAPGFGEFVGERRLDDEQIATIERWWKAGAPEGRKTGLKTTPVWSSDWQLGPPDLVVSMPTPYTLPAEGQDVYRNFVVRTQESTDRYVHAVEIRPGNRRVVHHVALLLDTTRAARARAAKETAPGFPGMNAGRGAARPDGHLITWQPGKRITPEPAGTAWLLRKGADLVLQTHMRPSGKQEEVAATVGLYFAGKKPERECFTALIRAPTLDIPPGATDHAVEASYTLPVDVELLGVFPHLHYLGKDVHGWAELSDGRRTELLRIKQWDFNWQGDYHYQVPPFLPKGTRLRMRYTYDNSAANVRNPHQPPRPVHYGPQTSDEMSDLFFQMLPRTAADLAILRRDYFKNYAIADNIAFGQAMLRHNPGDADARTNYGVALMAAGRIDDAIKELERAITDDPALARPHYILSHIHLSRNDLSAAKAELLRTLELDPKDSDAHNNLGNLLLSQGEVPRAIEHFEKALQLNPADALARSNLDRAQSMQARR